MRASIPLLAVAAASLLPSACKPGDGNALPDDGRLRVMVSVAPQADFVRRIGGEHVQVSVLVDHGQDPHAFSPTPSQMRALSAARIYLTVGMPFEEALSAKIEQTGSEIVLVSMADGFEKIPAQCEHLSHDDPDAEPLELDHEHHEHGEADPHVWLSPPLIKVQAENITRALSTHRPEHKELFEKNLATFCTELDALHEECTRLLKERIGEEFFVFHPAFGYFGYTYGIDQVAVELGGNNPTPKELAEFIALARDRKMETLFVQPQFDDRSARVIAEQLGANVEALDPLAADVLPNIRRIAKALARSK